MVFLEPDSAWSRYLIVRMSNLLSQSVLRRFARGVGYALWHRRRTMELWKRTTASRLRMMAPGMGVRSGRERRVLRSLPSYTALALSPGAADTRFNPVGIGRRLSQGTGPPRPEDDSQH